MAVKTNSIVKILLNRQMGYPDQTGNESFNKTAAFTRQLLNGRAPSEQQSPVRAVKVKLSELGRNWRQILNGDQSWIHIHVPQTTEVLCVDKRIWTREEYNNSRGSWVKKEQVFSVEPASGFKRVKSLDPFTAGKVQSYVLGPRLRIEGSSTILLTLVKPNILRGFDLVRNQVVDQLLLPLNISDELPEQRTDFTDVDVCNNCRKIFLVGSIKKLAKVIIVLDYPPWKEMTIIHINFSAEITISGGVCFIQQGKYLHITTWPLLMEQISEDRVDIVPRSQLPNSWKPRMIGFEAELNELPPIITMFEITPGSRFFGALLASSKPLLYAEVTSGLKFFTIQHGKSKVIFEFQDVDGDLDLLRLLPGVSTRLLCLAGANSRLIQFKSDCDAHKNENIVTAMSTPGLSVFNHWENARQNASTSAAAARSRGTRRSPRASVQNSSFSHIFSNKTTILEIDYCEDMDLIAVLTADEEEFQIAIYEPVKFSFVKALPPVRAWPSGEGNDDHDCVRRRGRLNYDGVAVPPVRVSVDFYFEPEFIYARFLYTSDYNINHGEVFFTRLLAEPEQPLFQ